MAVALIMGLGLVIVLALSGTSGVSAAGRKKLDPDRGPPEPPDLPPELLAPPPPMADDPEVVSAVSPELLEKKRLIVRNGFIAAENKRASAFAQRRQVESIQNRKSAVLKHFRKMGIVTARPDPTHPFWHQSPKAIADKVAKAVNTVPVT